MYLPFIIYIGNYYNITNYVVLQRVEYINTFIFIICTNS